MFDRLKALDTRVLGQSDAPSGGSSVRRVHGRHKLREDLADWGRRGQVRFWLGWAFGGVGVALSLVLLVPWSFASLLTWCLVPLSRRLRDSMRLLWWLFAVVNALAGFYAILLLPSSVAFAIGAATSPQAVYRAERARRAPTM
jgi:hypothetical protein